MGEERKNRRREEEKKRKKRKASLFGCILFTLGHRAFSKKQQ